MVRANLLPDGATGVPVAAVKVAELKRQASARGVTLSQGAATKAKQVVADFLEAGVSEVDVEWRDIKEAALSTNKQARAVIEEQLTRAYEKIHRYFAQDGPVAYWEDIILTMPDGSTETFPVVHSYDASHVLKNFRSAVAKAYEAWRKRVKAAAAARATATFLDDEEEPNLDDLPEQDDDFDEDDEDDVSNLTFDDVQGTPALKVALGAEAVLEAQTKDDTLKLINPRVLESAFQTQHVPTAMQLFSIETAAKMRQLGHAEAADWVELVATYYASFEWRGYSTAARRAMADEVDAKLRPLYDAVPPTARHIAGFSRDAVEGVLLSNEARRQLEAMVGDTHADLLYDRHAGSNKAETTFMVVKHRYAPPARLPPSPAVT